MGTTASQQPRSGMAPGVARLFGITSAGRLREALWGYVFLLPWALGLLFFVLGPMLASFAFSLSKYDIISAPQFVGLANYQRALFADELFWPSLGRTFTYAAVAVPVGLAGSLGLAMLLNRGLRGTTIFRTFFFLPHLTPAVAAALLWQWRSE